MYVSFAVVDPTHFEKKDEIIIATLHPLLSLIIIHCFAMLCGLVFWLPLLIGKVWPPKMDSSFPTTQQQWSGLGPILYKFITKLKSNVGLSIGYFLLNQPSMLVNYTFSTKLTLDSVFLFFFFFPLTSNLPFSLPFSQKNIWVKRENNKIL